MKPTGQATSLASMIRLGGAAAVSLIMGGGTALAAVIDLDAEVARRMLQGNRIGTAFQQATGQALPPGTPVSIQFAGATAGSIRYAVNQTATPKPEVIDSQRLINCNDQTMTSHVTLAKERGNSFTLSNIDTVQTSLSVEVSVDAPFASGSTKFDRTWSSSTTREQAKSDSTSWSVTGDIPLSPGKAITTQMILDTQTMSGSYRIPLVLSGTVNGSALAPMPNGYSLAWVSSGHWAPNALNVNADRGSNEAAFLCLGYSISPAFPPIIGNTWEGRCHVNQTTPEFKRVPLMLGAFRGASIGSRVTFFDFNVLAGNAANAVWMSPVEIKASGAKPFLIDPKYPDINICLADYNNTRIPGRLVNDRCLFSTDRANRESASYKVLMPAAAKRDFNFRLEDYIPAPDDRTVEVTGRFTGSSGTRVRLATSRALDARDDECVTDDTTASTGGTASAGIVRHDASVPGARPPRLGRRLNSLRVINLPVNAQTLPLE